MPLGEYLTGLLFFVPAAGAALGSSWLVVRGFYRHLPLLPRALAYAMIATAVLLFSVTAPAALGVLTRGTALAAALVALVITWWATRAARPLRPQSDPPPPPSPPLSRVIAAATVAVSATYVLARLGSLSCQPITSIDMAGFHLPGIARFIQTGTLWRVDQFLPGFATAQYPNSGDFLILSSILPWHDLAFVRYLPAGFYALSGLSAYALGVELGATRAAAASMAAAAAVLPALALTALEGMPDPISLACFLSGLVFLVRHSRSRQMRDLVLAGLSLGLSFGTKWYTTTAVAIVAATWIVWWLLARWPARERPVRVVLREWAGLVAMILLGGGLWLVRNLVESGNPVYPKSISLLGINLFPGSRGDVIDQYGYTVADYLTKPHILRTYIYPGFKERVGVMGVVLIIGLLLAVAGAVWTRRARGGGGAAAGGERGAGRGAVLALAAVVALACAEYTITPGSAYGLKNLPEQAAVNVRWLMPAILIAAALAARSIRAFPRVGWLLELGALAGALDAIHLNPSVSARSALVAAAALGLATLIAWPVRRATGRPGTRTDALASAPAVAAAVLIVVGLLAAGRWIEQRFQRYGYGAYDPVLAWIEHHAPTGRRIGITGVWTSPGLPPTLPAFGPRLGNVVAYVGDPVRHSLHLPGTQRSFAAELRRGRYQLLLIGLQYPGHTDRWARADGFHRVAISSRFALYAAPGRVPAPQSSSS